MRYDDQEEAEVEGRVRTAVRRRHFLYTGTCRILLRGGHQWMFVFAFRERDKASTYLSPNFSTLCQVSGVSRGASEA